MLCDCLIGVKVIVGCVKSWDKMEYFYFHFKICDTIRNRIIITLLFMGF